ncbi:MAG TPA: Hsp70 family protein, partial [Polyangia bacterium]
MSLVQLSEPGQTHEAKKCRGRAVGIDLGTTNSLVARVTDGQPEVIPDAAGRRLLPSVVQYTPAGEVIVGHAALAA